MGVYVYKYCPHKKEQEAVWINNHICEKSQKCQIRHCQHNKKQDKKAPR